MKSTRNYIFVSIRYGAAVTCIILGLLAIIGTGGSGGNGSSDGGSSSNPYYSGELSQATIDESNAEDIVLSALRHSRSDIGPANMYGSIETKNEPETLQPTMVGLYLLVKESLEKSDFINSGNSICYLGEVVEEMETVYGSCGGSATITIYLNDVTGSFSGTMYFSNYCETLGELETMMSGSVDISGEADPNTGEMEYMTLTYHDVNASADGYSSTLNGDMRIDIQGTDTVIISIDSVSQDNVTGKTFWLDDFTITLEEWYSYILFEESGRFYDHDYGYVDVDTSAPFKFYVEDFWPSEGILVVTGKDDTKAQLTVLSTETYQIEVDADGDGSYEWTSGILYWDDEV